MPTNPDISRAANSYGQATCRTCAGAAAGAGKVQRGNSCAKISATSQPMQGTAKHHAKENFHRPVISLQQGCGAELCQGRLRPSAAVQSTPAARQMGSTQPNIK